MIIRLKKCLVCSTTFFCLFLLSSIPFAFADRMIPEYEYIPIPPPMDMNEITPVGQPQSLESEDITIQTKDEKEFVFNLEIAKTTDQQRIGMMNRKYVQPQTGMLFLFSDDEERRFWMKNTLVPLDILFVHNDGIIHHIHYNAQPNSLDRINSKGKVRAVLEIGGGEAERLGIAIGDRIIHDAFSTNEADPLENAQ